MPIREYKIGDVTYKWEAFPASVMQQIQMDVMQGVTVETSDLRYTPAMLEYRRYFNAWRLTLPEGAIIDFPTFL